MLGNEKIANLLIKSGANVNLRDKYGCTPLHRTGEYGNLQIFILEWNFRVYKKCFMVHLGYVEIAEMLLENGADRNIRDNYGTTALGWARSKRKTQQLNL